MVYADFFCRYFAAALLSPQQVQQKTGSPNWIKTQMSEEPGNEPATLRQRLRQQALAARERDRERENQREVDAGYYREVLHPIMVSAAKYFRDIVEDLEAIGEATTGNFSIGPPAAIEVPFTQSDYRMHVDDQSYPQLVSVACTCELRHSVTRYIHTTREADIYETRLREMGIRYHRKRQEDLSSSAEERSHFTVEGEVRAGFSLRANASKKCVEITTHNLEDVPERRHILVPSRVAETLFEDLGRVLLRETATLIRSTVEPETRAILQAEAKKRQQEKARALADAEKQAREEAESRIHRRALRIARSAITERIHDSRQRILRKPKREPE